MAIATFKLSGLKIPQLIEKVRDIIKKVVTNVAVYPVPNPTAVFLTGLVDALEISYQAALNGGRDKKAQMYLDRIALLQNMSILQAYVQTTSGGVESKILLVADVKKKSSPVGILSPPSNIRSSFGYVSGEIFLRHGGVKGRIFYWVQTNPTPGNNNGWVNFANSTRTSLLLTGLTSGTEYAIRIATVSVDGAGAWSDPIIQKAL